ncbi:MAG: hypothetical protein RKO25_05670 [Candidatus Contendobacter sp.]|nr:hypothetical protein [Candidatus Contendobacter sp.]
MSIDLRQRIAVFARRLQWVGVFGLLISSLVLAADLYRWVNPETGEKVMTLSPPPYPIKEQRPSGRLPDGDVIEITLDPNAPEVKAKLDAYKAKEAERKRILEEAQRQRAAREAEEQRQRDAREVEEQHQRDAREVEEQHQRAAREVEEQRQRAAREAAEKEKSEQRELIAQKIKAKMAFAKEKAKMDENIAFILKTIDEFDQQEKFASTTARISLAIPINNLLSIKTRLDAREVDQCYGESKSVLQDWMKDTLNIYYEFSQQREALSKHYREIADIEIVRFWLEFPESCQPKSSF